ncbi:SRPBCC domain-containing protein [uncultured Chitinophaga sp.]|uniref:SRPBCC family protein n=1 Tax=uncultured Chitinophaga sp. TaxID=339340 RepID=UPI0025D77A21|nr:SRPBCC domain-containing protein [uncultured Chitinophaga sp.]
MQHEPLIVERVYDHPVQKVWTALSDRQQMKQWYFDIADFKPELGAEFSFTGEDGDLKFVHLCRITALEPGKKIAYTWTYEKYEGHSEVTFELFPEGDKTRLRLTHTGLESFPDAKSFRRESFQGGWNYIINESLTKFLDGAPATA